MRIIAGTMKGRIIPFDTKKYGADTTMQMVKEAVFGILAFRIAGRKFLDLFSCSGQIALEALSRGADMAVFNEKDRRRFEYVRKLAADFSLGDGATLMNLSWEKCIARCAQEGLSFDIIYCDPPYEKRQGEVDLYVDILGAIDSAGILADGGIVVLQYHYGNILEERAGGLLRVDERKYGQTGVSIYERIQA
jgi:16S rRNA (guanine(966)-N(2))-methyltransferase RsmD